MAVYEPLFVYLTPASIPQVVAHIQKYLQENPIISDEETIAELIREYIAAHPELLAVSSVNGKTGNVVLTGSDININTSSAVSIETQLLNLASMIQSASGDITQIEANISQIYTTIGTLQTNVETNASNISGLQTSVAGHGTRLAAAESDIDSLESAQSAQGTRLNTAEGNISSLQTRMSTAENDINTNESNIEILQSEKIYFATIKPVSTTDLVINANSNADVELNVSALPANYQRKAVSVSYTGHPRAVYTHIFTSSGKTLATIANPSASGITVNLASLTLVFIYTL